jgi:hypothetical protein
VCVQQLDIGYPESSLALEKRQRSGRLLAGDRAPDAPVRGAAGQPTRLFELFRGAHWTLLGYEVERGLVSPRPGLHIHVIGLRGDVIDVGGHFRDAYDLTSGDWVLVRPDGYVAAIVASDHVAALESYFGRVGLGIGSPNAQAPAHGAWLFGRWQRSGVRPPLKAESLT